MHSTGLFFFVLSRSFSWYIGPFLAVGITCKAYSAALIDLKILSVETNKFLLWKVFHLLGGKYVKYNSILVHKDKVYSCKGLHLSCQEFDYINQIYHPSFM